MQYFPLSLSFYFVMNYYRSVLSTVHFPYYIAKRTQLNTSILHWTTGYIIGSLGGLMTSWESRETDGCKWWSVIWSGDFRGKPLFSNNWNKLTWTHLWKKMVIQTYVCDILKYFLTPTDKSIASAILQQNSSHFPIHFVLKLFPTLTER